MESYIDISMPLQRGMPTYPGDPPFMRLACDQVRSRDPGSFNLSALILSTHTGTHVDAPRHFFNKGRTVDEVDWEDLVGDALLVDMGRTRAISDRALDKAMRGGKLAERVLLKAGMHSHLTRQGAEYLRDSKVRLVGIDSLSVDPYPHASPTDPFPAHHVLLGAKRPVTVVEGLQLAGVKAGNYTLLCMPLRIVGGDGAPARALLVRPKT